LRREQDEKTALERAAATLSVACDAMGVCIAEVRSMLTTKYDARTASHLAFLTKNLAIGVGELRKYEKDRRNLVVKMTPEERDLLLRDYVMAMPKERRMELRNRLEEFDAEAGVFTP